MAVGRVVSMRAGGFDLQVETVLLPGAEPTSGLLDRAQDAVTDAFGKARHTIVAVAEVATDAIRDMGERTARPDEMEVKFGLKFSAQGNVIVAGAAGEAALEVTLIYRRGFGERAGHGD
jgi:Trypsin-co-occurring domain 1